jgi:hypothetical protein
MSSTIKKAEAKERKANRIFKTGRILNERKKRRTGPGNGGPAVAGGG